MEEGRNTPSIQVQLGIDIRVQIPPSKLTQTICYHLVDFYSQLLDHPSSVKTKIKTSYFFC